ncbi:hydroxymethylbilane synthase [Marinibaculum pumilum]|uniref:Porphobilinogen deaminase n=1 Tax=Marinibaculum pumilum TaxID=1766165 RepID=A0ABV7KYK7_9PROT
MSPSERSRPAPALRIGTRGSPLALAQAREVAARLLAAHPALAERPPEVVAIRTTGDRITDRPLAEVGGKGLFTKEIEEALLDGRVDMAVHSMKDMPTVLPDGLVIDCLLPREDPRDALILPPPAGPGGGVVLDGVPQGAVVGTSSLRRRALLLHRRPDLKVVDFRGNVDTRLAKLRDGVAQATFLAMAGLNRLQRHGIGEQPLPPEEMLPAVAQGAIGIERRQDDDAVAALLAPLSDPHCALCVAVERAFLAELDGSCRTPIAGHAELIGEPAGAGGVSEAGAKDGSAFRIRFRGGIASPDGAQAFFAEESAAAADAAAMAVAMARRLLAQAGPGFLAG